MPSPKKKTAAPPAAPTRPAPKPKSPAAEGNAPKPALRLEYIDPATLTDNPDNWRLHPGTQLAALDELLSDPEVAWAGALLFNERTGRLIDGHGRKSAWVKSHPGQPVPVLVGSWSPEAEKKILLTLDPLAGLATPDVQMLSRMLEEVPLCDALAGISEQLADEVLHAVDDLKDTAEKRVDQFTRKARRAKSAGPGDDADPDDPQAIQPRFGIVITCSDEAHQQQLLEQFAADGLDCRALIT